MIPIIDAGHGAYTNVKKKYYKYPDGLAIYEGQVNRWIGKKLIQLLDKQSTPYVDFSVKEIDDIKLSNRTNIINDMITPEHYVISIHSNSASALCEGEGTLANGNEIWISKNSSKMSATMADIAESVYRKKLPQFKFRGVKRADFYILKNTHCPAFLVENLFFDNRREAEYLLSHDGQWEYAKCLLEIVNKIYEL